MLPYLAIRKVIDSAGMTDVGVSAAIGRSRTFIGSTLCTAKKRNGVVSAETMMLIADACGYSLAFVKDDDVPESTIKLTLSDD